MNAALRWSKRPGRAVAAIEFAVTFPILLFFLGAVTDFGISFYAQGCLSSVLEAGAAYATTYTSQPNQTMESLTATQVAAFSTNMQTVMQDASKQSLPTFSVTPAVSGLGQCYCLTGAAPASLTQTTCGSACTSGGTAGEYVKLTVTTTYHPLLPSYSMLTGTQTLSRSAWVPLQ